MTHLFNDKERSHLGVTIKIHPAHHRTIVLQNQRGEAHLIVSGGDLGDFLAFVTCDPSDINWVADALGCAPVPQG